MTEEERISRNNISGDGALRLLLHCNLTDSEVHNYSLQVSKHNTNFYSLFLGKLLGIILIMCPGLIKLKMQHLSHEAHISIKFYEMYN